MNSPNLIPVLLLALFCLALASGIAIVLFALRMKRERRELFQHHDFPKSFNSPPAFLRRPISWLAVRSRNLPAVQAALGLSNPRPCTWSQGLATDQKLFIAPPVNGWILITGSGLPDPGDDVDACFRFVLGLSHQLGQVQFFESNPVIGHHAWVRAETGHVIRAYVWAGKTLWNQGAKTQAEIDAGMKCFQYFEEPEAAEFGDPDATSSNTEKVPLLAERWSIDPAAIDERTLEHDFGVAGEPRRFY
jgi:hypothetical protein